MNKKSQQFRNFILQIKKTIKNQVKEENQLLGITKMEKIL